MMYLDKDGYNSDIQTALKKKISDDFCCFLKLLTICRLNAR